VQQMTALHECPKQNDSRNTAVNLDGCAWCNP